MKFYLKKKKKAEVNKPQCQIIATDITIITM